MALSSEGSRAIPGPPLRVRWRRPRRGQRVCDTSRRDGHVSPVRYPPLRGHLLDRRTVL